MYKEDMYMYNCHCLEYCHTSDSIVKCHLLSQCRIIILGTRYIASFRFYTQFFFFASVHVGELYSCSIIHRTEFTITSGQIVLANITRIISLTA